MQLNYQKQMEEQLAGLPSGGERPRLLLHACCAPCSSSVLERLAPYFDISLYFYNPNIFPPEEYDRRLQELYRLVDEMAFQGRVRVLAGAYEPDFFYRAAAPLRGEPEGGARCVKCFRLRLEAAARKAAEIGALYFTTTLTVSPHKNAPRINEIGLELGRRFGVAFLCSDFKKKEGYKRSLELSRQYGLYRQDYCGCAFSVRTEKT